MPYEVSSRCASCGRGDAFSIGHWPRDLGVFPCVTCKALVNLPLASRACPGCKHRPEAPALHDHAGSVPYYNGEGLGELEPGPTCLKCGQGQVSFRITAHYNVGRLGQHEGGGRPPWFGEVYVEKSIFTLSLVAFCRAHDLRPEELFAYFTLDPPAEAPSGRASLPIIMEIRNHITAQLLGEGLRLTNGEALRQEALRRFSPELLAAMGLAPEAPKRWWQVWR